MIRILKAFIPAALLAFLLASIFSTQANLAQIQAMGLEVGFGTRLSTTGQDIIGMASSYLMLITLALILALPIAGWLSRRFRGKRTLLFILAGFVAVTALHTIMNSALGIHAIAATRTLPGLLSQSLAGAIGAYAYCRLSMAGSHSGVDG